MSSHTGAQILETVIDVVEREENRRIIIAEAKITRYKNNKYSVVYREKNKEEYKWINLEIDK